MQSGTPVVGEQTNTLWIKAGEIYPYVGNPSYYRCPADTSTALATIAYPLGGRGNPRVRSVSMNVWVGAGSSSVISDLGVAASAYHIYRTETDLSNPGPANLSLILDENPFSINDAMLIEEPSTAGLDATTAWIDLPATYHNGSGGISFCDGHAQMRLWTDPRLAGRAKIGRAHV